MMAKKKLSSYEEEHVNDLFHKFLTGIDMVNSYIDENGIKDFTGLTSEDYKFLIKNIAEACGHGTDIIRFVFDNADYFKTKKGE